MESSAQSQYLQLQLKDGRCPFLKKNRDNTVNIDIINAKYKTNLTPETLKDLKTIRKPYENAVRIVIKQLLVGHSLDKIAQETGLSPLRVHSLFMIIIKKNLLRLQQLFSSHEIPFETSKGSLFSEIIVKRFAEKLKNAKILNYIKENMPFLWSFVLNAQSQDKAQVKLDRMECRRLYKDFVCLINKCKIATQIYEQASIIAQFRSDREDHGSDLLRKKIGSKADEKGPSPHQFLLSRSNSINTILQQSIKADRTPNPLSPQKRQPQRQGQSVLLFGALNNQQIAYTLGWAMKQTLKNLEQLKLKYDQNGLDFQSFKEKMFRFARKDHRLKKQTFLDAFSQLDAHQKKILLQQLMAQLIQYPQYAKQSKHSTSNNKRLYSAVGGRLKDLFKNYHQQYVPRYSKRAQPKVPAKDDAEQGNNSFASQGLRQEKLKKQLTLQDLGISWQEDQIKQQQILEGSKFILEGQEGQELNFDLQGDRPQAQVRAAEPIMTHQKPHQSLWANPSRLQRIARRKKKNQCLKHLETARTKKDSNELYCQGINSAYRRQREENSTFNLKEFFSQAYWRVVTVLPPGETKTPVGCHPLSLVTEEYIYLVKPGPESQNGHILITHLLDGTIGNFMTFQDKKIYAYVNLTPHSGSTGLYKFDKFSNERNPNVLQIKVKNIFAQHFEVTVDTPKQPLPGVSHIFSPIPGKSIIFSQPYKRVAEKKP